MLCGSHQRTSTTAREKRELAGAAESNWSSVVGRNQAVDDVSFFVDKSKVGARIVPVAVRRSLHAKMLSWSNNIPSRARILCSKFCSVCERQQHNCLSCFNDFQVDLCVLLPARLLLWESFDIYISLGKHKQQRREKTSNSKAIISTLLLLHWILILRPTLLCLLAFFPTLWVA